MIKCFSLRLSKQTLFHIYRQFQKYKSKLSPETRSKFVEKMSNLQEAIINKQTDQASEHASSLQKFAKGHLKKSFFESTRDFVFALVIALVAALAIRQMWFELYEIPSGSMRPTLQEEDLIVVSKTAFGINIPFTAKHLYFNPDLVLRSNIFTFTGEGMDIPDVDTMYFYLFPGKKQYIKRLMGKPGDTLYFYGGQIFGVDEHGKDISSSLQPNELSNISHIPFIRFEGKTHVGPSDLKEVFNPVVIYQMNEPVVKLSLNPMNRLEGELLPLKQLHNHHYPLPKDYFELWGIKNYAMARLLTPEQAKEFSQEPLESSSSTLYYLELSHHPSIHSLMLARDAYNRLRPTFHLQSALIPLGKAEMETIYKNITTERFTVKNGFASKSKIFISQGSINPFLPYFPGVPDGTYQFTAGKAYAVKWKGILEALPSNHPLYTLSVDKVALLFNVGVEMDMRFNPHKRNQPLVPCRYAFFRNDDLYLLDKPFLKKEDPVLIRFLQKEYQKESASNPQNPYHAFRDSGPPTTVNGDLDLNFIRQHGLVIPEGHYLALGDNYAVSADSREFGFVPQGNLRGSSQFIFWPIQSRFGAPLQPGYPWINAPKLIIWVLIFGGWAIYAYRRRLRLPLKF